MTHGLYLASIGLLVFKFSMVFLVEPTGSVAFAGCPCSSPFADACAYEPALEFYDSTRHLTGELNGSCVEFGYGAECGVHDRNLSECNVTSGQGNGASWIRLVVSIRTARLRGGFPRLLRTSHAKPDGLPLLPRGER